MRRLVPVLLASLLVVPAVSAEAGIGTLLRAAAKVGSAGAKVGKVGKLGKAGAVLKGAKFLGVGVAAERVFLHADDIGRVGVFVADDGSGALKVVMKGGDEVAHSADSFKGLVGELDEMAKVADDAGVDVFIDESALARLDDLAVGDNTRLFLANTDGPSWPIRQAANGAAEVGVAKGTWLKVGAHLADLSLDLALRLSSLPLDGTETRAVVDPDCDGAVTAEEAVDGAEPGDLVLLVGEPAETAELVALAEAHGVDVVLLGLADVCPPGEPSPPELTDLLTRMASTRTLGELWAVAAKDGQPLVLDTVQDLESMAVVAGDGVVSVFHQVTEDVVEEELVPEWAKAPLGALILFGFLGLKFGLGRLKQREAES